MQNDNLKILCKFISKNRIPSIIVTIECSPVEVPMTAAAIPSSACDLNGKWGNSNSGGGFCHTLKFLNFRM
jgi:hypothetical protein